MNIITQNILTLRYVKYDIVNRIFKFKNTLKKIKQILNVIDNINEIKTNEDGDILLNMKKDVIIYANGSILTYTEKGAIISKANKTFINPKMDEDLYKQFKKTIDDDLTKENIDILSDTLSARK